VAHSAQVPAKWLEAIAQLTAPYEKAKLLVGASDRQIFGLPLEVRKPHETKYIQDFVRYSAKGIAQAVADFTKKSKLTKSKGDIRYYFRPINWREEVD
jgi:hypothetical protein